MESMVLTSVWMFGRENKGEAGPVARVQEQGQTALEAMSLEQLLYFALMEKREA